MAEVGWRGGFLRGVLHQLLRRRRRWWGLSFVHNACVSGGHNRDGRLADIDGALSIQLL